MLESQKNRKEFPRLVTSLRISIASLSGRECVLLIGRECLERYSWGGIDDCPWRLGSVKPFLFPWFPWPSNVILLFLVFSIHTTLANHNRFIAQASATIFISRPAMLIIPYSADPEKNRLFSPRDSWNRLAPGIEAVPSKWGFCPGRNNLLALESVESESNLNNICFVCFQNAKNWFLSFEYCYMFLFEKRFIYDTIRIITLYHFSFLCK